MKKIVGLVIVLGTIFSYSCKSQADVNANRIGTSKKFVEALYNNDSLQLVKLLEGSTKIKSKEGVYDDCNFLGANLRKYGMPKIDEYKLTKESALYPRTVITIPIYKGGDSSSSFKSIYLELTFGPLDITPLGRVASYYIQRNADLNKMEFDPVQ